MRVRWIEFVNVPEEYYETMTGPAPCNRYEGEVIGCVRAFGETRLVVMLTSGDVRQVEISQVRRA